MRWFARLQIGRLAALWRSLQRRGASITLLLIVSTLGFAEPLFCILHCALLMPIVEHLHLHQSHLMRMPDGSPMMMEAMPVQPVSAATTDIHQLCTNLHSNLPEHTPIAQAFHELVLLAVLLLLPPMLVRFLTPDWLFFAITKSPFPPWRPPSY